MLARVQRRARSRSPRPAAQRRVRRERARATAASCSTSRRSPASSTSTTTSLVVDVRAGTFGDALRGRAARRRTASPRALAAVDGAVDGRRLARLPRRRPATRPATARSRTWSSASTSCSPTARTITHRRRARAGGRPRPHPAVRRLRGHARRHHRRPAARCIRRPPHERRAAYAFASFADGLDAMPAHPAPRRDARRAAPLRRDRGRPQLPDRRPRTCCSCSTRATPASSTRRCAIVAEECDARRRARSTSALVEHWLEHRNDVSALEALIPQGLRGRHDGDRRRRGATLPDDLRRDAIAAILGVPGTRGRVGPPVATPTPTAPASTSRSRASRRPTSARRYYRRGVGRGHAGRARRRRRAQPPPRRRPQPRPVRRRGARRRLRRAAARSRPRSTRTASSTPASSACRRPFGEVAWP